MMRSLSFRWLIPFTHAVLLLTACSNSGDEAADTPIAPTTTETTTSATASTTTVPITTTSPASTPTTLELSVAEVLRPRAT